MRAMASASYGRPLWSAPSYPLSVSYPDLPAVGLDCPRYPHEFSTPKGPRPRAAQFAASSRGSPGLLSYFSTRSRRASSSSSASAGLAGASAELLPRDADRYLGVAPQVLHPVRAVAAPGEHVEGLGLRHEGEPDLDLVRPARHAARRRQVTEVLVRERPEVRHRSSGFRSVWRTGSAAKNSYLKPEAFRSLHLSQLDPPDLAARRLW